MYHVFVHFDVQPDRANDFVTAVLDHAREELATEPGTLRFELIRGEQDPNRFYLDGGYADAAAFRAHASTERIKLLGKSLAEYATAPTSLARGTTAE